MPIIRGNPDPLQQLISEVLRDRVFMGGAGKAAVVGQFSAVELYNPVGSGITAAVLAVVQSNAAAGGFANLNWGPGIQAVSPSSGFSLLDRTTASLCQIDDRDSSTGGLFGGALFFNDIVAAQPYTIPLPYPIVLQEGEVINVCPSANNIGVTGSYVWVEF